VEFALLRRALARRIGLTGIPAGYLARLWGSAAAAAAVAWGAKLLIGVRYPVVAGVAVLLPYGLVYFALTSSLGLEESRAALAGIRRRLGRRR
jgi:putative peptidoglycan lipid II flippase